jgi:hypothetical protein
MSPLRFELARPQDDAELRQLLAATPMAGKVSVSFRREPSFFAAAVVEGDFYQTIVAREISDGRIVAFGNRSVRRRWLNGEAAPIGYLGGLRVLPEYRGGRVVAHGYRFLRELHADGRTQIYLTTIADDNDAALSVLTSGRAGLPRYEYFGNYHTGVIPLKRKLSSSSATTGIAIRAARAEDLPQLCQFVDRIGPSRQFFPCYTPADWCKETGTFRGLVARDIFLALRGAEIVGAFACWDQSSFRQIVVEEYGSALAWSAPVYNGWAALRGLPKLPQPGESLPFLTAALSLVAAEDRQIFVALLEAAIAHSLGRGRSHMLVGMHERDPLIGGVKKFQTEAYTTRCYLVYWEDGMPQREWIDGRVPYLELGSL